MMASKKDHYSIFPAATRRPKAFGRMGRPRRNPKVATRGEGGVETDERGREISNLIRFVEFFLWSDFMMVTKISCLLVMVPLTSSRSPLLPEKKRRWAFGDWAAPPDDRYEFVFYLTSLPFRMPGPTLAPEAAPGRSRAAGPGGAFFPPDCIFRTQGVRQLNCRGLLLNRGGHDDASHTRWPRRPAGTAEGRRAGTVTASR